MNQTPDLVWLNGSKSLQQLSHSGTELFPEERRLLQQQINNLGLEWRASVLYHVLWHSMWYDDDELGLLDQNCGIKEISKKRHWGDMGMVKRRKKSAKGGNVERTAKVDLQSSTFKYLALLCFMVRQSLKKCDRPLNYACRTWPRGLNFLGQTPRSLWVTTPLPTSSTPYFVFFTLRAGVNSSAPACCTDFTQPRQMVLTLHWAHAPAPGTLGKSFRALATLSGSTCTYYKHRCSGSVCRHARLRACTC